MASAGLVDASVTSWSVGRALNGPGWPHTCLAICRILAGDSGRLLHRSLILQHVRLGITWSQKLQGRAVPNVQMLFKSLSASCLLLSHWPQKVSWPSPASLWRGIQGGEEILSIFAVVLMMSSRIFPRICHFSRLSPPPAPGPKMFSSLVWLRLSSLQ